MAVGDDFKVSFRTRETIAELASQWRAGDPRTEEANAFEILPYLERVVIPSLAKRGRTVKLTIIDNDIEQPQAWVDLEANEIVLQRFIWEGARANNPHARVVVAHEIGHLVLHGNQVHAFSPGQAKKLNFLDPRESAECQANWFAEALLMPDEIMLRLSKLDDSSVATLTLVSDPVVRKRRREFALDKRYRNYTGDQCQACHNFTTLRRGITLYCDTCGTVLACN